MISDEGGYVPVNQVLVPDDRQRRHFDEDALNDLAVSIRAHGLINPIIITRENQLVAGERRLRAHQLLAFEQIAFRYADTLDRVELALIELEENIRREDLTWQERVRAIDRFHKTKTASEEEWSFTQTADSLNLDRRVIAKAVMVTQALDEGVKEVIEAPQYSTAVNFAQRRLDRQNKTEEKTAERIIEAVVENKPIPSEPVEEPRNVLIQQANFLEWSAQSQQLFNLIHCDFPYGVNATKSGQSSAKHLGGYDDRPEVYHDLLSTFVSNLDNFCSESAHLMFWFSMDFYADTKEVLSSVGWKVNPFPLVWSKSDNQGIIPDTNRGPRRVYETAFLASRGDRKIVRPVANLHHSPTTKDYHMSEKPLAMLKHFFRMLVDESTYLLDPTCGSGMAVKAAEEAGAAYALGLELSPEYVERAKENLEL